MVQEGMGVCGYLIGLLFGSSMFLFPPPKLVLALEV